jgi:ABC-type Fe3+/spermidine/putrescine transport system ATPase subunit
VAEFLGSMNVVAGRVLRRPTDGPGLVELGFGEPWRVAEAGHLPPGGTVHLGIRPEALRLEPAPGAPDGWNAARGTVVEVAYLGSVVRYLVAVGAEAVLTAEVHDPDFATLHAVGDAVTLWCPPTKVIPLAAA